MMSEAPAPPLPPERPRTSSRMLWHVFVPLLAPVAVVALYFTPTSVIACGMRGLLALAIVVASLAAGIVVGLFGLRARRTDPTSRWWFIATMFILLVPALLVLGPLG